MIDLYYWPTPNGHKITIFLEEAGVDYEIKPVDIGKGEQFNLDFLEFSPNNRIPAIVDTDPADGGEDPVAIFESGAILIYLAEKHEKYLSSATRERANVLQWLMWQMGGLGPMLGQNHHFRKYAPENIDYAVARYTDETSRLFGVMDNQLYERGFLADDYSIADMASYPWVKSYESQGIDINEFDNLKRWMDAISERPAVIRAYEKGAAFDKPSTLTEDARNVLFGQTANTVRR